MRMLVFVISVCVAVVSFGAPSAESSRKYTDPKSGITVVGGQVRLPSTGFWRVVEPAAGSDLFQVQSRPTEDTQRRMVKPLLEVDADEDEPGTSRGAAPAKDGAKAGKSDGTDMYYVWAVVREGKGSTSAVKVVFRNRQTDAKVECAWDCSSAAAGDAAVVKQWAENRARTWGMMLARSDSPVLRSWLAVQNQLFGVGGGWEERERFGRRGGTERTDAFGVLGGRAAIRETLQMQSIRGSGSKQTSLAQTPIELVPGLDVKSHPFGEMLAGKAGGTIPLAASAPADHLFVYFAKPKAMLPFLDEGNEFAFKMAMPLTGNNASYDLKTRYLARLGVSEEWVRLAIGTGAIQELGIVLPDLFLIDGTEMTVVARLASPRLFTPALRMIGLSDLAGGVKAMPLKGGGEAYWSLTGDLLTFSTSRKELERVEAARADNGKQSLGMSVEFRYMLTQLPMESDTRAYVYISDPFIRRLVGPQTKIAQLRRLQVRRDLEHLSSAALLYEVDGHAGKPDLKTLMAKGYLPQEMDVSDYAIRDTFVAESAKWGTVANMKSLVENPVEKVTAEEASAYSQYVTNYSQFWRQFFDPIAMRLDDNKDGGLTLTTFILPLIDSSIYNGIKEVVATRENGKALSVPQLTPAPVAMLSLQLQEKRVKEGAREMGRSFGQVTRLNPAAFAELGPGIHLAIQDSDPIVALGSGDVLGVFGSDLSMVRGGEMLMIPMVAAILTRPCNLMIELRNPAPVIAALNAAAGSAPITDNDRWGPVVQYYKLEGRDAWICSVGIMGVVKLRFGVEVRDGFLVINNIPWSAAPKAMQVRKVDLNGVALTIRPEGGKLQMPGLFTSMMESYRLAAMQGITQIYPLLLARSKDVNGALASHAELFGFAPEHPGNGKWVWEDGEVRSTVFGTPGRQVQPEYKEGVRDFGVFNGIDELGINLQFEDTGLRVKADWKYKGK